MSCCVIWVDCFHLLTTRANGSLRIRRSVLFWYFLISCSALVPGLYLCFSAQQASMQCVSFYVADCCWTAGYFTGRFLLLSVCGTTCLLAVAGVLAGVAAAVCLLLALVGVPPLAPLAGGVCGAQEAYSELHRTYMQDYRRQLRHQFDLQVWLLFEPCCLMPRQETANRPDQGSRKIHPTHSGCD